MIKKITFFLLLSLIMPFCAATQLTAEEQKARDTGLILYNQSAWDSAQPFLNIAATAGDSKAQYYLGEALRLNNMHMTADAKKWYEAAAEQGDLYAMLRLSSSIDLCNIIGTCSAKSGDHWRELALKTAQRRTEKNDTEAMTVLFIMGEGLSWLEKAAEAGDSIAQHYLAIAYKNGAGWFLLPGNRSKAVEQWAKASAEAGFAPGMEFYANFLYDNQRDDGEIAHWFKKTAEAGHLNALGSYAMNVAHLPEAFGYPLNTTEAYGITYLISKLIGGGAAPEDARRNLPQIAEKMTPEQIKQAIAYADEWERNHPPLSYYPPVYGY